MPVSDYNYSALEPLADCLEKCATLGSDIQLQQHVLSTAQTVLERKLQASIAATQSVPNGDLTLKNQAHIYELQLLELQRVESAHKYIITSLESKLSNDATAMDES